MKTLISRIKKWWEGEFIDDSYETEHTVSFSYHIKRPFIANLVSKLAKLWKNNWKELTIIILTFLLLIATIILIFRK
jgi:hypothetical protein